MRSILSFLFVASFVVAQAHQSEPSRDERVQVVLKNGHSLIGVAKAGVRCERLVRGNFKSCSDASDRTAGIRVWYYQDLDGYIFLESRLLDRVDVLGMLTHEESRALAEAVAAAHGRVQILASSRPTDRRGEGGSETRPAPATDPNALTAEERSLLERFPPDKGWSPEKFGELQRKKIVLHVNPNAEEQGFINDFPSFQSAWKKWLSSQPGAGTGQKDEEQPAPPKTDRNR